jgi:uncharacterized membrane protein YjjP (DUF1212 family)
MPRPAEAGNPGVGFILALARALHSSGEPTPRLERILERAAARLDLPAQFFVTPTSIFAAFGPEDTQRTHLIRLEPSFADLGKLSRVDRIVGRVLRGELTAAQGLAALGDVERRPGLHSAPFRILVFALTPACAARFLGGGLAEIATAAVAGTAVGLLAEVAARQPGMSRVFEPLAAFLAAILVTAGALAFGGIAWAATIIASLIVLVPGMAFTTAMAELTARHLASGTARLMGAMIVFLGIGFGVALGTAVAGFLFGSPPLPGPRPDLPAWTEGVALLVAGLSFGLLLRAEPNDLGWVVLACVVGFLSARLGGLVFGTELGMFAAATVVGAGSNAIARWFGRPVAVTEVPGLLILVPGSVGFRSVAAMLDREVISGVETAFQMLLIAVALVAGLLVGNLMVGAESRRGGRPAAISSPRPRSGPSPPPPRDRPSP